MISWVSQLCSEVNIFASDRFEVNILGEELTDESVHIRVRPSRPRGVGVASSRGAAICDEALEVEVAEPSDAYNRSSVSKISMLQKALTSQVIG